VKIMVTRNSVIYKDQPVETYSRSIIRVLRELGHEVVDTQKGLDVNYNGIDLLLDLDCGRNSKGELIWQGQEGKLPVKSAVIFIDSHGYPSMHHRLSPHYDHVFFAVWRKRDLFTKHPSAHWCPNFTDLKWFDGRDYMNRNIEEETFDYGFFGSKGGLSRADPMKEIAERNNWKVDIRQVGAQYKHQWPFTSVAMSACKVLFNHSQKSDGPNLRVFESMLMLRPLICDQDPRSGLDKLFKPWAHYIPYQRDYSGLEEAMHWAIDHPVEAKIIADAAYTEVRQKHLVGNRIEQILEVCE